MKTTLRLTPNRLEVLIESLDQYVANEEDAADLAYTQNALARLKTAREILDELNAERAALAQFIRIVTGSIALTGKTNFNLPAPSASAVCRQTSWPARSTVIM